MVVVVDTGTPGYKPLMWRDLPGFESRGLHLASELEHYPLRAEYLQRYYGVSHRHTLAVHWTGQGQYMCPDFGDT